MLPGDLTSDGTAPRAYQAASLTASAAARSVHVAERHSFTGVRTGAPLAFSSTTTNLAGSVLLALRPTT